MERQHSSVALQSGTGVVINGNAYHPGIGDAVADYGVAEASRLSAVPRGRWPFGQLGVGLSIGNLVEFSQGASRVSQRGSTTAGFALGHSVEGAL